MPADGRTDRQTDRQAESDIVKRMNTYKVTGSLAKKKHILVLLTTNVRRCDDFQTNIHDGKLSECENIFL